MYDPLGNVLGEASPHGAIRFDRDELGRLDRAVVEDPWGDVETSFERDELGRVIAEHQLGRTLRFGYDIVEIPAPKHSIGNPQQHPFGNQKGQGLSGPEKSEFNAWRQEYWRARAREEIAQRGEE